MSTGWDRARTIADAVLYEGYLLYPYRASSAKNQSRWQFGVLGPPGAAEAAFGEDDTLSAQFLVDGDATITLVVQVPASAAPRRREAHRRRALRTGRRTDRYWKLVADLG